MIKCMNMTCYRQLVQAAETARRGYSPRQLFTSKRAHCQHASANALAKSCTTSWLSFTGVLQRNSAVNFKCGRGFSKTGRLLLVALESDEIILQAPRGGLPIGRPAHQI